MSRTKRGSLARIGLALLIASCLYPLVAALVPAASAKKAEATFKVEVPSGEWKGARIKNIPAGATLGVEATVDGAVDVLLISAKDYGGPGALTEPVFRGHTSDRLSFSVIAPETGHYYVVIDNRAGSSPRSGVVTVRGETQEDAGQDLDTDAKLQQFERRLSELFEFESFSIHVRACPKPEAFVDFTGVVLCQEYVNQLREHVPDKKKMEDVLLFTLFHEIGHVLLKQWEYPTYANEETADEFATVLIIMLNQQERLDAPAEFFDANASLLEVLAKASGSDRHPLSAQRARNVRRWSQDADLVRRWQAVFVPRMRTPLLERLRQTPTSWADQALVERELAARR